RLEQARMNVHAKHPHGKDEPRIEDQALVSGEGRFVDDVIQPGMTYAAFVRSPHAFAKIISIDIEAAREAPGVVAVFTAADMERAGVGDMARHPPMGGRHDSKLFNPFRPALASTRVMHVGECVAMVVAE